MAWQWAKREGRRPAPATAIGVARLQLEEPRCLAVGQRKLLDSAHNATAHVISEGLDDGRVKTQPVCTQVRFRVRPFTYAFAYLKFAVGGDERVVLLKDQAQLASSARTRSWWWHLWPTPPFGF